MNKTCHYETFDTYGPRPAQIDRSMLFIPRLVTVNYNLYFFVHRDALNCTNCDVFLVGDIISFTAHLLELSWSGVAQKYQDKIK